MSWKNNFIINLSNLLLPVCIYVEKVSNYLNAEVVYVQLKKQLVKIDFSILILT